VVSEATKKARAAKRKGASWETDLVKGLRAEGFDVERLHLNGKEDEGDLVLTDEHGKIIIEAKNVAKLDLAGFVGEAMAEADNYVQHRGLDRQEVTAVVAIKARGKSWKEGYLVTTIGEFLDIVDGDN